MQILDLPGKETTRYGTILIYFRQRSTNNYLTALIKPTSNEYLFGKCEKIIFEEYQSAEGLAVIKSATILSLIERLTCPTLIDKRFSEIFFITFRLFCTPEKLLYLLIQRFRVPTPIKLVRNENNYANFRDEYKYPIQKRVLQSIYVWICHHFYDFAENPVLLKKLVDFFNEANFTVIQRIWCEKIKVAF